MISVTCIEKIRNDRNEITHYKLEDELANTKIFTSKQLKHAIQNKHLEVTNLTLTSNNRLIAKGKKKGSKNRKE